MTHQAGRSGLATTQGQSDGQSATFDPASSWTDQTGQFFAGACGVSIPLQTSSEPFACLSIKTAGSEILLPQEVGLLEQLASDMAMVRDSIIQREALQRSERWFRVLFESATIGILVHDPQKIGRAHV